MSKIIASLLFLVVCAAAVMPVPAFAVVTVAGVAVSGPAVAAVSVTGEIGLVGGAVVAAGPTSWWNDAGLAFLIASVIVVAVDPPEGTFYNGSFSIHFPSALLEPIGSGWLGAWGDTPSDVAPPVDPSGGFPGGAQFVIHLPNPALDTSTFNDLVNGVQTTTFDWGPTGFAVEDSGPFNFHAAMFRAKQDLQISFVGTAASTLPGANLFTTNNGISCSVAGSSIIQQCGSPATQSFSVSAIPEPETYVLMLTGIGLLSWRAWRYRMGQGAGIPCRCAPCLLDCSVQTAFRLPYLI